MPLPLIPLLLGLSAATGAAGMGISAYQSSKARKQAGRLADQQANAIKEQARLDSETAKYNTDQTISANKALAEYEHQKNMELWDKNNQFNSPEAQMSRLKEAGLNPNMVYGQGAVGNASSPIPKYNAPRVDYGYKPSTNLPAVIGAYQDVQMKSAQIDMVRTQQMTQMIDSISKSLLMGLTAPKGLKDVSDAALAAQSVNPKLDMLKNEQELSEHLTRHKKHVLPYQAAIIGNEARGSEAELQKRWKALEMMSQEQLGLELTNMYKRNQVDQQSIDKESKEAELLFKQFRNEWTKEGITSSDNLLLRIFVRMMNSAGMSPQELFGSLLK